MPRSRRSRWRCPVRVSSVGFGLFEGCPVYPRKRRESRHSLTSPRCHNRTHVPQQKAARALLPKHRCQRTFAIFRSLRGHEAGGLQCEHHARPSGRSFSGTCLSSALLTNSTESIAAPSSMRNCSIASFIGAGRSPHQSIARLIASSTVRSICSIAISR